MAPNIIILDVSGRRYQTTKVTLQTSPYFRNLLDRWEENDKQEDGSYYVDADPDTFQHVLNFMRRPSTFPLFWTRDTGFDYELYTRLKAEADYFLLQDLNEWISKKRFEEAVKIVVETRTFGGDTMDRNTTRKAVEAGDILDVQSFFGSYDQTAALRNSCPTHHLNGIKSYCKDCQESKKNPQWNDPPNKLTVVTKKALFNLTICVNDSDV